MRNTSRKRSLLQIKKKHCWRTTCYDKSISNRHGRLTLLRIQSQDIESTSKHISFECHDTCPFTILFVSFLIFNDVRTQLFCFLICFLWNCDLHKNFTEKIKTHFRDISVVTGKRRENNHGHEKYKKKIYVYLCVNTFISAYVSVRASLYM